MYRKDNKIKKTIRLTPQTLAKITGYIDSTGESFSAGVEEILIRGLENLNTAKELKKIVINELKKTRQENRNNSKLISHYLIKLVGFVAKIYGHTRHIVITQYIKDKNELQRMEEYYKNKFLEEMKS